jgi:hypothetical protein
MGYGMVVEFFLDGHNVIINQTKFLKSSFGMSKLEAVIIYIYIHKHSNKLL